MSEDRLSVALQRELLRHFRDRYDSGEAYWMTFPYVLRDAGVDVQVAWRILVATSGSSPSALLESLVSPEAFALVLEGERLGDLSRYLSQAIAGLG